MHCFRVNYNVHGIFISCTKSITLVVYIILYVRERYTINCSRLVFLIAVIRTIKLVQLVLIMSVAGDKSHDILSIQCLLDHKKH